jgi:tRNA-specific 2-thiouridylase
VTPPSAASVTGDAGGPLTITLGAPARGVAPGQAAVLYDGDLVLGSATIMNAHRLAAAPA